MNVQKAFELGYADGKAGAPYGHSYPEVPKSPDFGEDFNAYIQGRDCALDDLDEEKVAAELRWHEERGLLDL